MSQLRTMLLKGSSQPLHLIKIFRALTSLNITFSQRLGVRSESMNKLSLIYFACSVIFLASGCLFFVKELKSSARSPAASRYKSYLILSLNLTLTVIMTI